MINKVVQDDLEMFESWERQERDPALAKYVDEFVDSIDFQIIEYFKNIPGYFEFIYQK